MAGAFPGIGEKTRFEARLMPIPSATYRIQFNAGFTFRQALAILPYLEELGISDLYSSPIFLAHKGSTHGYDVINPLEINPDLGTMEEFTALTDALRARGMGWLQDVVPNHMAYDQQNPYLVDVLENGPSSPFYNFFDIDWEHPYEVLRGRVLAPFLGDFFGKALENGEIRLTYDEQGFSVNYYDMRFPLRIESYHSILTFGLASLRQSLGEEHPDYIQLLGVLYVLKTLRTDPGDQDRYNQVKFIKNTLWALHRKSGTIRQTMEQILDFFNGEQGNLESFTPLDRLLGDQNFRLSFWKVASEEINYRRFFSINNLISLRAEREEVFQHTHELILRLLDEGIFTGLRVDHIDGLCDPEQYLHRLRSRAGDRYIVVEKILELDEPLPATWPVQGTTGYEFLNRVCGLFCQKVNERSFTRIYQGFTGLEDEYEHLVYEKKKLIIERHMTGDITNLSHLMKNIASRHRYGSDITLYSLRRSLMEIMAFFPVYRTYIHPEGIRDIDRKYIHQAIQRAADLNPGLANELAFLEKILLLQVDEFLPEEERELWLQFVMRFQQFTGPLMAKGFEDTLLYVYNRLLSVNEVGSAPERFGTTAGEFHTYCRRRQQQWPHALSASATHDTKRGEDARARINVLSEIPQEWGRQLKSWHRLNRGHKKTVRRKKAPVKNDEYLLYQTLLGTYPNKGENGDAYLGRIREYVIKAVREAKTYTAWIKPDAPYEESSLHFAEKILDESDSNPFTEEFRPFQRRVAFFGMLNSLAQTLVKITAPGVPDFYQGTELWDFSLVDPDNRRPVDFEHRRRILNEISGEDPQLPEKLLATMDDGRIKMFLIHKALGHRRGHLSIYQEGEYLPVETTGLFREHILAYARHAQGAWAITVVPRFLTGIIREGVLPVGDDIWEDTAIVLPEGAGNQWHEIFTATPLTGHERHLLIGDILRRFPVALLSSD
jgi:(1->4)-alpha-D-glucan 1-alpha-D-glucosylmutase